MTASTSQVKEDYLTTMGDMLYDQNDLNSGENSNSANFEKLDSKSEAALDLANDLGIIQDIKQKVITTPSMLHQSQNLCHSRLC